MKKFSDFSKNYNKVSKKDETTKRQDDLNSSNTEVLFVPKANLTKNIEKSKESNKKEKETGLLGFDSNPVKFFSKLFESREMAHIYHLQVKGEEGSYAAHMALGSYYDNILGLIDDLIEIYQGQYDIIEGYDIIDTSSTKSKDKIEYFKELADFIKSERKCISPDDTHLHNIIDEILGLVYKTLYKLRFNK